MTKVALSLDDRRAKCRSRGEGARLELPYRRSKPDAQAKTRPSTASLARQALMDTQFPAGSPHSSPVARLGRPRVQDRPEAGEFAFERGQQFGASVPGLVTPMGFEVQCRLNERLGTEVSHRALHGVRRAAQQFEVAGLDRAEDFCQLDRGLFLREFGELTQRVCSATEAFFRHVPIDRRQRVGR